MLFTLNISDSNAINNTNTAKVWLLFCAGWIYFAGYPSDTQTRSKKHAVKSEDMFPTVSISRPHSLFTLQVGECRVYGHVRARSAKKHARCVAPQVNIRAAPVATLYTPSLLFYQTNPDFQIREICFTFSYRETLLFTWFSYHICQGYFVNVTKDRE